MTKVRMHFHKWNWCGGNEYWLNFKQGQHNCSIKKQPYSVKGVAEIWSSEGEHNYFSVNLKREFWCHHIYQKTENILRISALGPKMGESKK